MKRKLAVNAGWITAIQLGQRILELGFTAALARLLDPADFGVVAAAMIVIQLAQLLVELGVGATLVQLPNLTERDVRAGVTVIGLNAVAYALATVLLAPVAAMLLDMDALTTVLRILSLMFLIQAIGVVPEALLVRRLEARRVVTARFAAKLAGTGLVGVGLAVLGFGYWALVAATLVETGVAALWLWTIVRPPMRPLFDRAVMARLLKRGSGFSASRLLNFTALRGDNALVGHYLDAAALGLYARAYNLMNMPADLYGTIAERLVFPALASVQGEPERLRRAYLQGLELTALFGLPMSVLLYILAPEMIGIILGPKWHGVILPFSILAVATFFRLGMKISGSVQRASGATRQMIWTQGLYAMLVIGGCLIAMPGGITRVALAVSMSVIIAYIAITLSCCHRVGVALMPLLLVHRAGALLALTVILICAPVVAIARSADLPDLLVLLAAGLALLPWVVILVVTAPSALLGTIGRQLAVTIRDATAQRWLGLRGR